MENLSEWTNHDTMALLPSWHRISGNIEETLSQALDTRGTDQWMIECDHAFVRINFQQNCSAYPYARA